jgi:predicted pyridoxine 5'-phosphate oxidase superfamily flavin-nucleotide-binding protein
MTNRVESQLTTDLFDFLQRERFVTISTIDYETGGPNVHAISWVFSPNREQIRFALDNRSRIVRNIRNNPLTVLTLITSDTTYSINGNAYIKEEHLEDVPLKLALIELEVKEVRDVMFYGSKITYGPKFEKTYDLDAATKLDSQVMQAIKKA